MLDGAFDGDVQLELAVALQGLHGHVHAGFVFCGRPLDNLKAAPTARLGQAAKRSVPEYSSQLSVSQLDGQSVGLSVVSQLD